MFAACCSRCGRRSRRCARSAYWTAGLRRSERSERPTPAERAIAADRVALLTPMVKAWCTDLAQEIASMAVQVHGGMGFIEETGVAQHYRDAKILSIYEGTNGIQAMDLVGRKLAHGRRSAAVAPDRRAAHGAERDGRRVRRAADGGGRRIGAHDPSPPGQIPMIAVQALRAICACSRPRSALSCSLEAPGPHRPRRPMAVATGRGSRPCSSPACCPQPWRWRHKFSPAATRSTPACCRPPAEPSEPDAALSQPLPLVGVNRPGKAGPYGDRRRPRSGG